MARAASSRWGLALAAAIFVAVQACAIAVDFDEETLARRGEHERITKHLCDVRDV